MANFPLQVKSLQKELNDASSAVAKTRLAYMRSRWDADQAELSLKVAAKCDSSKAPAKPLVRKRDESRLKAEEGQESYSNAIASMNTTEKRVKAEAEEVLAWLETIETSRLAVTKEAMTLYSETVLAEMVPIMQVHYSIDSTTISQIEFSWLAGPP